MTGRLADVILAADRVRPQARDADEVQHVERRRRRVVAALRRAAAPADALDVDQATLGDVLRGRIDKEEST